MTFSQKYSIVSFIRPLKDGDQFHMANWPLHITLADTFAIDKHSTNIDSKLASFVSERKSFSVKATEDSVLGTTPVVLLSITANLKQLHDELVTLLEDNGATFNNPAFNGDGFLAHSTIQKSGQIHRDDEVRIDSLSLIDMFPDEAWQQRKILATFKL